MTTENLNVMQAFTQKIDWLEQRQKTLAQNIANADTPHYRPGDLKPIDFKGLLNTSSSQLSLAAGQTDSGASAPASPHLATTEAAHMNLNGGPGGKPDPEGKPQRRTYEIAPAGNSVVLEEQLLKMGENYADHRLMTNLYQKNVDMLKMSLK